MGRSDGGGKGKETEGEGREGEGFSPRAVKIHSWETDLDACPS